MKPLRIIRVLFAGAAVTLTWNVATAHAGDDAKGDACWSKQSEQALAACPGNGPQTLTSGQRGTQPKVHFKSAPQAVETKKADQKKKPGGPTEEPGSVSL